MLNKKISGMVLFLAVGSLFLVPSYADSLQIEKASTSTFNLKMMNALRAYMQVVDEKSMHFKDKSAAYKKSEAMQASAISSYRTALKSNEVKATEVKVNLIKKYSKMLSEASKQEKVMSIYEKLTVYINKQLSKPAA